MRNKPHTGHAEGPIAELMNTIDKIVFSNTLDPGQIDLLEAGEPRFD